MRTALQAQLRAELTRPDASLEAYAAIRLCLLELETGEPAAPAAPAPLEHLAPPSPPPHHGGGLLFL